jgi:preprotein translocase subunit SecF
MADNDLSEKERAFARQVAKEMMSLISEEVGRSVIQKVMWAIILAVLGGAAVYVKLK